MSSSTRRLLLLSVSAGAGHVRAAQAVAAAAAQRGGVTVEHIDLLTLVPAAFRKLYGEFYLHLVERHPNLWAHLYERSDRAPDDAWFTRVRRAVERLNTRALQAAIEAAAPDAILCTHFLPAELLSRDRARGAALPPVWVQVTDFDLHRLWVQPGLAGYFVASGEIAFRLRERLGSAAGEVAVTGIPIMPAFALATSRAAAARALGLDAARPTLMVMTGGTGLASGAGMVEALLRIGGELQVVAIAGRNAELLGRYQALAAAHPGRLLAIGFTDRIEQVMAACDIAVTKPGGLSTSECLAMALPMLLISPIPGQEERNAHHLLEQGAALLALDEGALEYRVRLLLREPARLAAMKARCLALRQPDAAAQVLARMFG